MKHPNLIDELGALKARKAELVDEERALIERIKHEMLAAGERFAEGALFRAAFVVAPRLRVNTEVVAALFPPELFPSIYDESVTESLRVAARVGVLEEQS